MNVDTYYKIVAIPMIAHIFVGFFVSLEIIDHPIPSRMRKAKFLIAIWLFPIIGVMQVRKNLGLKWASGSCNSGNATTSDHSDNGDGACGGGDGPCN